jgi:hypothetical protein
MGEAKLQTDKLKSQTREPTEAKWKPHWLGGAVEGFGVPDRSLIELTFMRREPKVSNLKMRHHSLSRKVAFTDANDHNPVVLDECPKCHGSGKASEYGPGVHYLVECDACSGTGTTGQRVRYFDNDARLPR